MLMQSDAAPRWPPQLDLARKYAFFFFFEEGDTVSKEVYS